MKVKVHPKEIMHYGKNNVKKCTCRNTFNAEIAKWNAQLITKKHIEINKEFWSRKTEMTFCKTNISHPLLHFQFHILNNFLSSGKR